MKTNIQAVVLSAGKATRFRSQRSKLLEPICGQPMILYATDALQSLEIPTTYVVGYQAETVQKNIQNYVGESATVEFVLQEIQGGTGHALMTSQPNWKNEHILVMNGDMPLVTADVIERLANKHIEKHATISFITAHNADPALQGYGRVIKNGKVTKIVEAKDFSGDVHEHCCINAGIYLFNRTFLEEHIKKLTTHNAAKEFYITDLIQIASNHNHVVETVSVPFDQIRGVNTYKELWTAEQIKRSELITHHMNNGVRFCAPQNIHLDMNVTIGAGTTIGGGVRLEGTTAIGKDCTIEPLSILDNATIEDDVTIYSHTIVRNAIIKEQTQIGPFAHIHEGTTLSAQTVVGNFVEMKRSTVGTKTKIKHHAYISDSNIGNNVNVGAGAVTCNYDGTSKHTTVIEDGAFIGSNNTIVAPITIGKNAYTAGGSIINQNVPEDALAIGRAHQVNKAGYATKIKEQREHKKNSVSADNQDTEEYSFVAAMKDKTHTSTNDS